jgi:hypothetical protein
MATRTDAFGRGYIEAALWSSTDDDGESLDHFDASNIDAATRRQMYKDCKAFKRQNRRLLRKSGLSQERQGHDFWLTRNRHGAGFWDEGIGRIGNALTKAAHAFGSFDLYLGDDGKIHGS